MNQDSADPTPPLPDRPHGLDPRALLAAVAAPTVAGVSASAPPLPHPEELAAAFPQLEIGECLGRGGMGVVYRARQRSLDRMVALKLLAPERGNDPDFAARFAGEAQALARLNHPNIVTIHDFGRAGGFYYLLMEYVDGVNLRQAMLAGRFTPEQALAIVPPVCEALQYAHTQGIVHRDIKPENLLLDKEGRIKIADFGIAKMLGSEAPDTGLAESQPAGTPKYMAPEQRDRSRRTDHRADIYSLGVVLYELLTGEVPGARLEPPSRRVQIDVRLDEIVLRALEAEPDRRYQTAVELRTCIEGLGGAPDGAPRPQPAAATPDATSTAPAISAPGAPVLRAGTATVTTPERLATASGQFFHFRNNRHQLVLHPDGLTLANGPEATTIPWPSIRDVSLGRFPRLVNPAGLDFISLTYDVGGGSRRLVVAPFQGVFGSPAAWNSHVQEWWAAIREAVAGATGREPAMTPASQLGTPASSRWLVILLALPLLAGLILGFMLLDARGGHALSGGRANAGPGLSGVVLLTLIALSPMLVPVRRGGLPTTGIGRVSAVLLFVLALGLTFAFAAPHRSVLGAGNIETWTVGLPAPWISDIRHSFPSGGGQRLREMHLDRVSFYCGFGALAAWMGWIRLRAGEAGAAKFELVKLAPHPGGRPRVRWGNVARVWTATACLSVITMLLICVVMNQVLGGFPAPMPLLVVAVIPVSLVLLKAVRQAARLGDPAAAPPSAGMSCLAVFFFALAGAVAVAGALTFFWMAARSPSQIPSSPTMVPPTPASPSP